MRRLLLRHRADPLALDEITVERLLARRLPLDDVPPAYTPVIRLLDDVAGPATPRELRGEQAALAAFAPRPRPETTGPNLARHRRRNATVVVLAAALALGGATTAAAAGSLPGPAQHVVSTALGHLGVSLPDDRGSDKSESPSSTTTTRTTPTTAPAGPAPGGPGPALAGPERAGLCRAYFSGQGGVNGDKDAAVAFQRLAEAAGSAQNIPGYCAATGSGGGAPTPTDDAGVPPSEIPGPPASSVPKGQSHAIGPAQGGGSTPRPTNPTTSQTDHGGGPAGGSGGNPGQGRGRPG